MTASALRVPPVRSGTHHRRRMGRPGDRVIVRPYGLLPATLPDDHTTTTFPGYLGSTTPLISLANAKGG
jgi:hypothetical protein